METEAWEWTSLKREIQDVCQSQHRADYADVGSSRVGPERRQSLVSTIHTVCLRRCRYWWLCVRRAANRKKPGRFGIGMTNRRTV